MNYMYEISLNSVGIPIEIKVTNRITGKIRRRYVNVYDAMGRTYKEFIRQYPHLDIYGYPIKSDVVLFESDFQGLDSGFHEKYCQVWDGFLGQD